MLGWEFPPFFAGGAGMVCKELTRALNDLDVNITFVMPKGPQDVYNRVNEQTPESFEIRIADSHRKTTFVPVKSLLGAYDSEEKYTKRYDDVGDAEDASESLYGGNLGEEIYRYANVVTDMFHDKDFDVIHAHDWVTHPAAKQLKELTGKPLVTHVHITEHDKSGGNGEDEFVTQIEKEGMDAADRVVAVSNRVKEHITQHYDQPEEKIDVVHNAPLPMDEGEAAKTFFHELDQNIVLFAGRVTLQKGPEYFIDAANEALKYDDNLLFVVAGDGDMLGEVMERAAHHGISEHFLFTGFYTRDEANALFSMADVFVMPSVSEPFGIVPYEAQTMQTPTIISEQSGISEVLNHTFTVDFWDTRRMAEYIIGLANYETMNEAMATNGQAEVAERTWHGPAKECKTIYEELRSQW
jgi:glycosyltransferase involved in cell wall biosynthesis